MLGPVTRVVASLVALAALTAVGAAEKAANEILVAEPYARAALATQDTSAAYMTLRNFGKVSHAVVRAHSRAARAVELHTHVSEGGMMRMRQVERVDIPAGESTVLEPGGLHVMLIGLTRPLRSGTSLQLNLEFEDGSTKAVVVPIAAVAGMGGAKPTEAMGPVFVNLTSDDHWRASMALGWTMEAMARGHQASIFLNVEAVRLAVRGFPHPTHSMQDRTAQELLREAMSKGARVLVCAVCLKRAGFHPDNLIEGAEIGTPDAVMSALYADGVRVMAW